MSKKIRGVCFKCGASFQPTPSRINRAEYSCRACTAKYEKAWREKRRAMGLRSCGGRHNTPAGREKERLRMAARMKNPIERLKALVRRKTRSAIEAGFLVRKICEKCGAIKTDAHHDDYTKPLEVRWLCRPHHADHHRAQASAGRSKI